jgi:GNAT superfamily N-acetyltransferase
LKIAKQDGSVITMTEFDQICFRCLTENDKAAMLEIAARIWEGDDYLSKVYDKWASMPEAPFVGIFAAQRLVGCGRISPLNKRIGWLEGLRIDPDQQRRGLGKQVALEMIRRARGTDFSELLFSTYFDNYGSIVINERLGFTRIATYTTLNLKVADPTPGVPAEQADLSCVSASPGMPSLEEMICNGWVFLPPETENREAYFPDAETVSCGESCFILAANNKSPDLIDEICWLTRPDSEDGRRCLSYAIERCRRLGKTRLHLMLPEDQPIQPFYDAGFTTYERERDVFVYRGIVADLKDE